MGCGVGFKCSKCGKEYETHTGIGMGFPMVYKRTIDEVKNGRYGEEWKRLALSEDFVAVDAERYLYICEKCGYWTVDLDLSLYAPNDPETIKTMQYGEKTVEEWGKVPYVMRWDLEQDYHLLKKRIHKCKKCGDSMRIATSEEEYRLPCPECGGTPEKGSICEINWD